MVLRVVSFGFEVIFPNIHLLRGLFEIDYRHVIILVGGILISLMIVCICICGVEFRDQLFFECPFRRSICSDMLFWSGCSYRILHCRIWISSKNYILFNLFKKILNYI